MPPFFTIFTPTYNRRHTLPRLIDSLKHAGSIPFEWLVMDDGSNDDTYKWLLSEKAKLNFPVRVYSQPNAGKHAAHNAAIPLAKGQLVIILDSDDELAPMALDQLWASWQKITPESRDKYAGILGNSADYHNKLVGSPFPHSPLDGHQFELSLNGSLRGEKLPCYRQDILARFLFPELTVKSVIPEGLIWNRISDQYYVRCINEIVRIYHKDEDDTLSLMNSYKHPSSNVDGTHIDQNCESSTLLEQLHSHR